MHQGEVKSDGTKMNSPFIPPAAAAAAAAAVAENVPKTAINLQCSASNLYWFFNQQTSTDYWRIGTGRFSIELHTVAYFQNVSFTFTVFRLVRCNSRQQKHETVLFFLRDVLDIDLPLGRERVTRKDNSDIRLVG
jgi:hypothetical protein